MAERNGISGFDDVAGAFDPRNRIHRFTVRNGRVRMHGDVTLPTDAFTRHEPPPGSPDPPKANDDPLEKLHPLLRRKLDEGRLDEPARVVIGYREDLTIPRFPEPAWDEPRDAAVNLEAARRTRALVEQIRGARADGYQAIADDLEQRGIEVVATFWLVRAVVADAPLGRVLDLLDDEDVVAVDPQETEDRPPGGAISDGRTHMGTDQLFDMGLAGGWIGLLDTGVRASHVLLAGQIGFCRDCVDGGDDCSGGSPHIDSCGHGTGSAAILGGSNALGPHWRGVTAITIDSWKVYTSRAEDGGCGTLDTVATQHAFENALLALDRVIVAEMQASGTDQGVICRAANHAFDAGAVIIAANGNIKSADYGTWGTVRAPAQAHRVIGVGAVDVTSGVQLTSQACGPTEDGRYKPDVQGPSRTGTASGHSDTAMRADYGGTSAATAYVGGAAALLRNLLVRCGVYDPGQVYALLVLAGRYTHPLANTVGAGPVELAADASLWCGAVEIPPGFSVKIPLCVPAPGSSAIEAALWWPEGFEVGPSAGTHGDLGLDIVAPDGADAHTSQVVGGVFQRARAKGPITSGTWHLRIRALQTASALAVTTYWAALLRRDRTPRPR